VAREGAYKRCDDPLPFGPMSQTEAPYGTWRSPIDGDAVARDSGWTYSMPTVSGGDVYWSESRPLEGGRDAIVVRRSGAAPADAIPADCSARTRVHEYGGGEFTVHDGTVFFCHDADQRIHRVDGDKAPRPITPEPATPFGLRYADLRVTPDGRWIVGVRERDGDPEHINELVALAADGSGEPHVIASGHDFYSSPRVSPDGTQLAWLTWDHPRMPWEGSELWVAELAPDATLSGERLVAGGPAEAIVQPQWSPDGVLHFSSDRTGWWNLYRGDYEPLTPVEAEVGGAMWVFGMSWYAFLDDGRIVCSVSSDGRDELVVVEAPGQLRTVPLELTRVVDLAADGTRAVLVGASPTQAPHVVAVDLETGEVERLSPDAGGDLDSAYVSVPRPLDYPTTGGETAHALFYPPHNADFSAPAGERPPLLVRIHGGPTAHVTSTLSPELQFFTSRGFAVVDVNYGGSTGYGREYRDRLRGQWGVVDTDDAVNAARALAEAGEVDGARMAITGGSAGGWTVLCALAFHPDVFAAGADYFGVSDLSGFVDDTHKFESRYNDWLVGPWPEAAELWRERSPINHADRIRSPVIVLQGLEDKVVPPSQSEVVVKALADNGIPHAYIAFEGEQHGFRRADSLKRAAEAEISFYAQVLGFELGDPIEPVEITGRRP
jgi:dipeptidyl aminopeptidase/acylaminoacyl peptidase